ncbi:hypothetical protein KSP39_PZI016084 [Platanthera zijinensis]|uniref:Chorein N-terminal domain-containing protein n=1 Tax=Platanthera zijinensis TaxID=2320716 RepID=A0AAP0G0C2_9ASPA
MYFSLSFGIQLRDTTSFAFCSCFSSQVLYLLRKYLSEYIELFFDEALRVLKGEIVLKDLRLDDVDLTLLNLPYMIKVVFMDTITIPALGERSWLDSNVQALAEIIFGDFKVIIRNVHIRYEDSISNPGHPFCCGVTFSNFVLTTTDEQYNETFDASGVLDKLRESLQMLRLAVYHDSESAPWMFGKSWGDWNFVDWTEIFQDGIDELDGSRTASLWTKDLRYMVFPINGALEHHPLGILERRNMFGKVTVVLSNVYFTVSETQYYWCIKLLEALSTHMTRVAVSHLRPDVLVLEDTHAWWRYAMFASLQQKKLCWFSWERIKHLCQLRRRYVQIYSKFLQRGILDIYAMRKIERILDSEVILLWRRLAHAELESVGIMKRIWLSLGWYSVADARVELNVGEAQNYSKKTN